jgi:outer membrane protein TolC
MESTWTAAGGLALVLTLAHPDASAAPQASTEPPAAAPEVLTLERALTLALEGNREIRNAVLDVTKAEDTLRAFRTQGLPQFSVYALGTRALEDISVRVPEGAFGDFPATGPIPATDTDVTTPAARKTLILGQVARPLTQLRNVSLGTRLKRANLEITRERLRAKRQAVEDDVRRAYYGLLRSQSGLAAAEEALAALRELDRVVEERVAQRVELPAGGLEVKARLAREEHEALSLRNGLVSGREQLNDLLGRPIDVPFSVDPVPEIAPYEADLEATRCSTSSRRSAPRESPCARRSSTPASSVSARSSPPSAPRCSVYSPWRPTAARSGSRSATRRSAG